jgi:hypothetical protein
MAYHRKMNRGGHPVASRPNRIVPKARAGRIGVAVVAALVGAFFVMQVIQLIMMDELWSALLMVPIALAAIAVIGSIAGLSQSILPQTRAGRIGVWLFEGFVVSAAALAALVAITGGARWLAALMIPLGVTALGGGIASVIAFTRDHDRGMLVILPLMVALLAVVFLVGEFATPH